MHKVTLVLTFVSSRTSIILAGIDVLQILQNVLRVAGYPAVTLFVMIESSGIPFPGELMLLLAAFYAAIDQHLLIPIVIACAALGAVVGDNIGYYVGHTGGKALVERYGHYIHIRPKDMQRAENFFARYGDKAVFFGRFVAILRAWAAFLAGVNEMRWRTFFLYNAAGGIVWSIIFGLIGFYAGKFFHANFQAVEHLASGISWLLGGLVVIVAIVIGFFVYRRNKKRAQTKKAS